MRLTINSDETLVLTGEYRDRKHGPFKDRGRFIFVNDRVIEVTDKKGVKTYPEKGGLFAGKNRATLKPVRVIFT